MKTFSLFLITTLSLAVFPHVIHSQCRGGFVSNQTLYNFSSWRVSLGDLDSDGDLDAFIVNEAQPDRIWLNDGTGFFTNNGQALGSSSSRGISLGDLDSDGDLDALVVNLNQPNTIWLNNGTGTFTDSGQALGSSWSTDVSLGDLDNDGDLDAFIVNGDYSTGVPNQIWLNDGTGRFTDSGQTLGNSDSKAVSLGDLDGDGDLDAVVTNKQPTQVWLNDSSGTFLDGGQVLGSSESQNVSLGDLDGDGDLDVFVTNDQQPNQVWLNDGTGTFNDSGQVLDSSSSKGVSLGDLDNDDDLDAFVIHQGGVGEPNKTWLNDGTGMFTDSGQSLGSSNSADVALGDLDNDGDLDAFVVNIHSGYRDPVGQPEQIWFNKSVREQTTTDCTQVTEIPLLECETLTTLYNRTDGINSWRNNTDWCITNTPCNWQGIECHEGHVTSIDLWDNHLHGSIPAKLANLGYLQKLDLSYNQLSGPIPPQLGNISNLQELNLSKNILSLNVPTYLFPDNYLSGPVPPELGNLSNLQQLDLSGNQLSGPIPPELGNLSNLQQLSLSSNQLSGLIPPELGNLRHLEKLDLSFNQLSGPLPPELSHLSKLHTLYLTSNQLSGLIPPEFSKLSNLDLSENQFNCRPTLFSLPSTNQLILRIPALRFNTELLWVEMTLIPEVMTFEVTRFRQPPCSKNQESYEELVFNLGTDQLYLPVVEFEGQKLWGKLKWVPSTDYILVFQIIVYGVIPD